MKWTCRNPTCKNDNTPDRSRCVNCAKCIPPTNIAAKSMKESLFTRYTRLTTKEMEDDDIMKDEEDGGVQGKTSVSLAHRKKQINLFIHVLEELPRIDRDS